jgi:hypothetical protein
MYGYPSRDRSCRRLKPLSQHHLVKALNYVSITIFFCILSCDKLMSSCEWPSLKLRHVKYNL